MPTGVYMRSAEHRKKVGDFFRGKKRHFTEDHRKKLSQSAKNRKSMSEETKKKISIAVKERWQNPEYRKRLSEAHIGNKSNTGKRFSTERKRQMSITRRAYLKSLTYNERVDRMISMRLGYDVMVIQKRAERGRLVIQGLCDKYGFSALEKFFPSTLKDHEFARDVLIEKTKKAKGYYENTGLIEHPIIYPKNPQEKTRDGVKFRSLRS